jgi:cell division protein FtsI/penicillin-binding protein 2
LRTLFGLALLLGAGLGGVALAANAEPESPAPTPVATPEPAPLPPASPEELLAAAVYDAPAGGYVAQRADGTKEKLTLLPALQKSAEKLLASYRPPLGELVAMDPATGRILAWARVEAPVKAKAAPRPGQAAATAAPAEDPISAGLAEDAFPAASVFKLVTASALLERGVTPEEEICYHGGQHRIQEKLLGDNGRRDRRCVSLSEAIAHSANVAIAKLADRDLDPVWLRTWADRLLFNHPLPTPLALAMSQAQIPDDRFDFATTAAGFGNVTLTPLHGVSLAAAIGHDGLLVSPHLSDDATALPASQRLLPEEMAHELSEMMAMTVREGTARRAFASRAARALGAAGKTGSLSTHSGPFRDYSWFVGFAPALSPQIAVAAVVVNGQHWRVHASQLASSVMQAYLKAPKAQQLVSAR